LESVLVASESIITHRRRYPALAGLDSVIELLVLDPGNPRSIAFQLNRIDADLGETRARGAAIERARELPSQISARLKAVLTAARVTDPDGRHRELVRELDGIDSDLRELYDLIDTAMFAKARPLQTLDPYAMPEAV
ncbi:alpha-E domain-containing protein, partial [Escherichia coli]|uniref:alpha-E domain-containing protein n=1 Tax=Escherichia coli TaxID=562 RepID=UPI001FA6EA96